MDEAAAAAGELVSPPPELCMVARAVQRLVARNDGLLPLLAAAAEGGGGERMAAFEAARGAGAPHIGVAQYLERVHRYAGLEPECYVVAYAYVDRAAHRRPAAAVASRNVHRLLLACLLVASKVLDDFHHNNAFFARVGGVSNAEMNKLELELLAVLEFEVMVSRRLYDLYRAHLEKETQIRDVEGRGIDGTTAKGKTAAASMSGRSADGGDDEDDGDDRRLPNGAVQDWMSQQGTTANGGVRRHSSSPSTRYSFSS